MQMLRSVNAHQQHEQQHQQQHEFRSPKWLQQGETLQLPKTAATHATTDDEEGEVGKSSDSKASPQSAVLLSGCYVCGRGKLDSSDIFIELSNEGAAGGACVQVLPACA
jgi:hypothetical protein